MDILAYIWSCPEQKLQRYSCGSWLPWPKKDSKTVSDPMDYFSYIWRGFAHKPLEFNPCPGLSCPGRGSEASPRPSVTPMDTLAYIWSFPEQKLQRYSCGSWLPWPKKNSKTVSDPMDYFSIHLKGPCTQAAGVQPLPGPALTREGL